MQARRIGPAILVACLIASSLTGCAATRSRRGTPESTGFLGDYSQLRENPDFPASLVYVRPGVQWSAYTSVQLDSVGLWANPQTAGMSAEDRQMLTDVLYSKLKGELSKYFTVVDHPAADAIRLRVALTDASGAKPVLRTVTTIVPQLRLLGGLVGLAGDTAATVGEARMEMEVLDEGTNQRLAAAVDERAGTKVVFAKRAYTTWGDVETLCDYWAKRITWQLARHGVQMKPGASMPEEPSQSRSI
jgi:hypothetical protein